MNQELTMGFDLSDIDHFIREIDQIMEKDVFNNIELKHGESDKVIIEEEGEGGDSYQVKSIKEKEPNKEEIINWSNQSMEEIRKGRKLIR